MNQSDLIDGSNAAAQPPQNRWRNAISFVVLVAVPLAVGALGSVITASSISDWYPTLIKPSFNPPNWLFGPVWTTLYIMMGFASWRIWRSAADIAGKRLALSAYAAQLALNFLWSVAFFGLRSPLAALFVIAALTACLIWTLFCFWRIDRLAGSFLVPYLAWVSFAAALNLAIVVLN